MTENGSWTFLAKIDTFLTIIYMRSGTRDYALLIFETFGCIDESRMLKYNKCWLVC